MLEFQHGKVKLKGGLRIADLHFIVQQVGKDVTPLLHKAFLLELVSSVGQLGHRVGQFPYFGEGFHNGQCGLRGFRTFEDSGKSIYRPFSVKALGMYLVCSPRPVGFKAVFFDLKVSHSSVSKAKI